MDIFEGRKTLLLQTDVIKELPYTLLKSLLSLEDGQYVDAIAGVALSQALTSAIFSVHEPIFVEICGRWLASTEVDHLVALSVVSRVITLRPHLSVFAKSLLNSPRNGILQALASRTATALQDVQPEMLQILLLSLHRLVIFDNAEFAPYMSPAQLQLLLGHDSRSIRYLAIKLLCSYLHTSEVVFMDMVQKYLGSGNVDGPWEGMTIDYTFLSLWERKRLSDLAVRLQQNEGARKTLRSSEEETRARYMIHSGDLSATSASLGGVLVPRMTSNEQFDESLVMTPKTFTALTTLAHGINSGKPLLLSGVEGCGKTAVIRHAARVLGMESSMVTLHLNEQTDSKLLIGLYTSSNARGGFTWQPGILTKAVLDGRWIVIEDIDRAPPEILSTLLPLLERRELFVPHRGEHVRAAGGFKLIATVRTSESVRGATIDETVNLVGRRLWSRIAMSSSSETELAAIIRHRHPILQAYVPTMMAVYTALKQANTDKGSSAGTVKTIGPRDLLRWSARIEDLLLAVGATTGSESISEATNDDIFLEAVDCFATAIPSGSIKLHRIYSIARELHMPAKRVEYCLQSRVPRHQESDTSFSVGRAKLFKKKRILGSSSTGLAIQRGTFSFTDHVSRTLESVSATIRRAEPCLLVGETGTGKTTIIQKLALLLNQDLAIVNLSQQSDAGDLLGGFKPVNLRSLAMPMKEEFGDLIELTFKSDNQQYINISKNAVAKAQWPRALALWQQALKSVQRQFETVLTLPEMDHDQPRMKKRKGRMASLKARWSEFEKDVQSFQMHLSHGSKGFAFSFVESNIVKAARHGNWVLLDEINLASPDTLESLGDLLGNPQEGGPSLLLAEKGDLGRIQAHPDFRIFGAMNPATDAGKRELPPNIRPRFTEIFVEPPDNDINSLLPIIKAYLGNFTHLDVPLSTDVAQLYLKIKKLAHDTEVTDGTGQRTHFSLRTLTRTLSYAIDVAPVFGLRRALFEGFCMCFLTILDKASAMILQPLIKRQILGSKKLVRASRLPQDGMEYVEFGQYWISKGPMPVEKQLHYVITPFIDRNLSNLVRATSTRKFPVLLQGPTSSGKTSMIEHLAKSSGNKFVRINNHEHTDLQEYLGSYVSGSDGRLHFQEGLLVEALREGHWIVLDELNLAPTDVLEALNRLLDDNRELFIPETQQTIRPHKNFMLFATQNPPGLYGGRKVLSRAFRNRFLELHFDDIPEDELETILRERSQIAPSFCSRIVAVYKELSILRQNSRLFEQRNSFATLRDLFRWALRDADDREQLAANGFMLLAERVRNIDERNAVKHVIEGVMKVKIDKDRMYSTTSLEKSVGSPPPAPMGVIWTHSMRRLYTLVSQALKHHEPVLLVGETGCGKTTICQVIAEIMRTKLHMVNAHQNMETGDLIGSQRPLRDKAAAQSQLFHALYTAMEESGHYEVNPQTDLVTLVTRYETLIKEFPESVSQQARLEIDRSRRRANSLFEWADGSLVQAMREGQYFLLDEISLADDSVLERLNSVLEPGRSLLLAEKGSSDVFVTAASNFEFLATMNPGGDYGKRELSPALRNRFTEIWVPRTMDENELLEIVQAKLPSSKASLARPIVTFAAWYASRFDTNAGTVSIRDLLAWITFASSFTATVPGLAVLHGAAMVYLDRFGTNPTAQMSVANAVNSLDITVCLEKLSDLFACDMMALYLEQPALSLSSDQIYVGDFSLKKRSAQTPTLEYSLQAPTTRINTMKVVRALQLAKPILLEGSPGVGKTTLVTALAKAIGVPLTRINLSEQTDLMDLFGSDVPVEGEKAGNFTWRDAPFLRAMQKGEWVLLDEMNLASQSVLEGLNACLDHRGQVYVSELDRTFSRHPNFVVFAAQNPYLQGGGRKGLPESFVNRFTVVNAQALSKQDLMVICGELFPRVSNKITERLVDRLGTLNSLIQSNAPLTTRGGPWEFNLRDILRWLQLLAVHNGPLALASPADFANILFVRRFRTAEDQDRISKVFEETLPYDGSQISHYHSQTPRALQVGFATLPKNDAFASFVGSKETRSQTDLHIAESLMICVQESWPCLLVGASGSGKTALIEELAASVGAELCLVSLHSDMDTMDLVGGFEQLDTKRSITGLISRVKAHARRIILQRLLASPEADDEQIFHLESMSETNHAGLLESLEAITHHEPTSEGLNLLAECRELTDQLAIDQGARFEWVDGIVVSAIQQGEWLVLDNANLCSPSVLDRLNSLLEPDGFLSVNEHRDADGKAHIVKPHPNFRLIMTMDPRHGELSRAMRNRSLELFMPIAVRSPKVDFLGFDIETFLSRFSYINALDLRGCDDTQFFNITSIFLEHLAFTEFDLCDRWIEQVSKNLIDMPPSRLSLFQSVLSIYQEMLASGHIIVDQIQNLYGASSNELGMGQEYGKLQSIHPFNNSILLSVRNPFSKQLHYLGDCLDLLVETNSFHQKLSRPVFGDPPTLIKMSIRPGESGSWQATKPAKDNTTGLTMVFLHDMACQMSEVLSNVTVDNGTTPSSQESLQVAKDLIPYLESLFDLARSDTCNEANLLAHQALGRSVIARATIDGGVDKLADDWIKQLSSKLDTFTIVRRPSSGRAMEKLWTALRPPTARSMERLQICLDVEALADRFDSLKWHSGASLPELIRLHTSLTAISATINDQETTDAANLGDIEKILADMTIHSQLPEGEAEPYFRVQFEILAQIHALEPSDSLVVEHGTLELLACKLTKASMKMASSSPPSLAGWSTLSQVLSLKGQSLLGRDLPTVRQIFLPSTLKKITKIDEVSLRALNLLIEEVDIFSKLTTAMCEGICDDPIPCMQQKLRKMRSMSARILEPKTENDKVNDYMPDVADLSVRLMGKSVSEESVHSESQVALLKCSMDLLPLNTEHSKELTPLQLAQEWIQVFAGLLLLYVPDRPIDPVLPLVVELQHYKKRKVGLENKLIALQTFERAFSGQTSNYRTSLLQGQLELLGSEPQIPTITRPPVSQLGLVQGEFNNVLKSIVLRLPNPYTLETTLQDTEEARQELELLRVNITEVNSRLVTNQRAYDDITKPVIAMLTGLDIGLNLAVIASQQTSSAENAIAHVCKMTPFLGERPALMASRTFKELEKTSLGGADLRVRSLQNFALLQDVDPGDSEISMRTMFETFHSFYKQWKEKLDQDKREHAVNSSLYRYRGSREHEEDSDDVDFKQLFPTYDNSEDVDRSVLPSTEDPKHQAQRLAHLHRQIFQTTTSADHKVLEMIETASKDIADEWSDDRKHSLSPLTSSMMVPAMILSLGKARDKLQDQGQSRTLYNFYIDANIVEAQKVEALVQRVQAKFRDLQEAWPEHATLADVLKVSNELLALRHSEPVAKILTKLEQLHGFVHEWQIVASREYNVASLYTSISELIISWRRMELSTWGRLLDMEDKHCIEDSDSWWFIAYEVIVAVPMTMIDNLERLEEYAQQLFELLGSFLATTSLGQYAARLSMIKSFEGHVTLLSKQHRRFDVVRNALANFFRFYDRFVDPIRQALNTHRQTLEKKMKEILLLASWKDTNIVALRDSARRSHHKLFKVVRKYRSSLAQSAESILHQRMVDSDENADEVNHDVFQDQAGKVDPRAIEFCQQELVGWREKRSRDLRPDNTVQIMFQISQLRSTAMDGAAYLNLFATNLTDNMKALRKETPAKSTSGNVDAIKHLKSRKRHLFSETLKAVRVMGFRSNVGADILKRQDSIEAVLSRSPFLSHSSLADLARADQFFDQLLNILPQARQSAVKHSDDLTNAEAIRGVGYLESILSILIKQRATLSSALDNHKKLEETSAMMGNLWAPDKYAVWPQDATGIQQAKDLSHVTKWLPTIVDVGCNILEVHTRLNGTTEMAGLDCLRQWQTKASKARGAAAEMPVLPHGISSTQHSETLSHHLEDMEAFRTQLRKLAEENPNLAYIFKQVEIWTKFDKAEQNTQENGIQVFSISDLDTSISKIVENILFGLQQLKEALVLAPGEPQEAHWLLSLDNALSDSLKGLYSRRIERMLNEAMAILVHLDPPDSKSFSVASAICGAALPIVQQYVLVHKTALERYGRFHRELCRLASTLAKAFTNVAEEGFCSPPENNTSGKESNEELEGGTGLGEGEGAEDISKDVQDDEDLSELAQQNKKEEDSHEIQDQDDAVDMDHDELEGETEEVNDQSDGEHGSDADDDDDGDMDDEMGNVDDLDAGAIDENLWEGRGEEDQREKRDEDMKDKSDGARTTAAESEGRKEEDGPEEEGTMEEQEMGDKAEDEDEEVAQQETETIDPHHQEGQHLDLPEEMDLDDMDNSRDPASDDDEMEKLSDVEDKEGDSHSKTDDNDPYEKDDADKQEQPDGEEILDVDEDMNEGSTSGSPVDTEPDEGSISQEDQEQLLQDRTTDAQVGAMEVATGDTQGLGNDGEQRLDKDHVQGSRSQGNEGAEGAFDQVDDPQNGAKSGETTNAAGNPREERAEDNESRRQTPSQAFKKLGDALEEWHRQNSEIQDASDQNKEDEIIEEAKNAQEEFEHLGHEEEKSDAQALGAASKEQARPLDDTTVEADVQDQPKTFAPEDDSMQDATDDTKSQADGQDLQTASEKLRDQNRPGAFVGTNTHVKRENGHPNAGTPPDDLADIIDLDNNLSLTSLQPEAEDPRMSLEEARHLWLHYENIIRASSLSLTERLRLILAPTLATKMRGDFRTGKRLNIKRIIPYIASNFKRDKIWMRRSIPSKRTYQIMLAVDDSKSMSESESGQLAFQTLALIAKSLSMLEAGEICIVGFGNDVFVAHDFETPFSAQAGAAIVQRFNFQQDGTNMRRLIVESIRLFREARFKSSRSSRDLWQVELIISDGVCEDHQTIKRLVRQATEERIMIVFVIVDALLKEESIMDMRQAIFEPDSATGEKKVQIKRYMDDFPFTYYVVVGNVEQLPGVLAQALRQWFAEVTGDQG